MNRDEIRMKLWCEVYQTRNEFSADTATELFDERFPAESGEPVRDAACLDAGCDIDPNQPHRPHCDHAESSEPADKPKRVWVTFDGDKLIETLEFVEDAEAELAVGHADSYAEFQQVGPMVRRDDE